MLFQLHVDIDKNTFLYNFQLLNVMKIESMWLIVKESDLYIIKTACKTILVSVILLFKYKDFYLVKQ